MRLIQTTNGQKWRVVYKRVLEPTVKKTKEKIYYTEYQLVDENEITRDTYYKFREGPFKVSDGNKIVGYIVNGVTRTVYHLY